jgi:hypothetical protein
MAISVVNESSPVGEIVYVDSNLGNALSRVKTSSAALFYVTITNTLNNVPVYVKMWDAMAAGIVLGTTAPDLVLACAGNTISNYVFYTGAAAFGFTFTTALTAACLLTGGSEGSANPPPSPVSVLFSYV